ncbi:MAG: alpha/beta hydrolase-fold protein [Clostridium sp.]|nr:alpha/beta hydrolase-fold protein [Prevotella sp.]MCM1429214.1 alpha/beta hydrolase-fold protein [Clostridium sp.]MCM1475813.1 alpha/beta hydrolase-fold protein [Muribaculaceae bacterium]
MSSLNKMRIRTIITGMLALSAVIAAVGMSAFTHPPLQKAQIGKVHRRYVPSVEMGDTITIDVWTPEGYRPDSISYPVIFMHDGQNLYDSTTTWNRQSWEMDSIVGGLISSHQIPEIIIAGVHSVDSTRLGDLMPENAIKYLKRPYSGAIDEFVASGKVRGNAYAAFLANTLRPMMIEEFNISSNPDSTFVMGSSMGGLMSVYAMTEYPQVFGAAACLSTHWIGTLDGDPSFREAMASYLRENLPSGETHRLYFDRGTATLDSNYKEAELRMISLVDSLGYNPEKGNFESFVDTGGAHEERSWARRVAIPLKFLFPHQ